MSQQERRENGFPVEVALFDTHAIKHREAGTSARANSDTVYSFTLAPDTTNEGIFCDAPGSRPDSISWGITLDPVPINSDFGRTVLSASALYVETTGPELLHLIACLQNLYDVNYPMEVNPNA